jgi:putative heme iron utilization protein
VADKCKLARWEIDEIIQHMNEDHADSLLLYARHYGECFGAISASLTDVARDSCTLFVEFQNRRETAVIKLKRPVTNIKQAEVVMIEMHFEALRATNEANLA